MPAPAAPPEHGTPWGLVAYIAKKDGVIGVFLVALCWFIWTDSKADRADRERAEKAYKVVVDSLVSSHRREYAIAAEAVQAIRTITPVADNTRRTLQYVERFHHRTEREN